MSWTSVRPGLGRFSARGMMPTRAGLKKIQLGVLFLILVYFLITVLSHSMSAS